MKHECQTLSEELEELRQTNRENASTLMGLRNAVISYVDVHFATSNHHIYYFQEASY